MDFDEDDPLTLPKWPFYVGDVFLVGSALAIATLNRWNMTDWQVASCVVAVGLGAFLFVLPFIAEYHLRLKERDEGFARGTELAERHLSALAERVGRVEEGLAGVGVRIDAVAQASDRALERAGAGTADIEAPLAELRDGIAGLSRETDKRLAELKELIPEDGGVQAAVFVSLSEKVKKLEDRIRAVDQRLTESTDGNGAKTEAGPRSPRKKQAPEVKLLHRAMKEKDEAGSPAVKRIIGAGPRPAPPADKPVPPDSTAEAADPDPAAPAEAGKEESEAPEKAGLASPVAGKKKENSSDPPARAKAPEKAVGPKQTDEPAAGKTPETPDPPVSATPPGGDDEAGLLVDVEGGKPKPRKRRPRKGESQVLANVFIGIGNKPFIRGSGGGLNWKKGVPMQFEEIGKWSWIAPADCGEIEVRIFRNDEDPDTGGARTLKPGEKLELKPEFQ